MSTMRPDYIDHIDVLYKNDEGEYEVMTYGQFEFFRIADEDDETTTITLYKGVKIK